MDFRTFILEHENDDTSALLLGASKWPDIDISLAVNTIESRRKLRAKLPGWYAEPSMIYPSALSAEQCSGAGAASFKARVAAGLFGGGTSGAALADLTGGIGADCAAFSRLFPRVLYNDMSASLTEAARHNFSLLGIDNVSFRSVRLEPGSLCEALGGFRPDVIYLDPARRSSSGSKVFRLEDCSPDLRALMPELLSECRFVLAKLSPMADISLIANDLRCLSEIYAVGSGGECKELLAVFDREFSGEFAITVAETLGDGDRMLSFRRSEEAASKLTLLPFARGSAPEIPPGRVLFEPGKALMKSGAFKLPCSRFGLAKLAPSTHLYISDEIPAELLPFGKVFRINDICLMTKASVKEAGRSFPQCEVTSRNLKISSDELRSRMGSRSGGEVHVFAAKAENQSGDSCSVLLFTSPL